jgi:Aspartyl protease
MNTGATISVKRHCHGSFASPVRPLRPLVCPPQWLAPVLTAGLVLLVVLGLAPASGPAQPRVYRVPFRSAQSMILIEGKVNGDPVTFLLDTGSLSTIVSTRMYRFKRFPLPTVHRSSHGPGIEGESISVRLDLQLGSHRWVGQRVSIMNLDELSGIVGIPHLDGLLGEDILREFRSVRIDYKSHVIELEE